MYTGHTWRQQQQQGVAGCCQHRKISYGSQWPLQGAFVGLGAETA